MTSLRSIVLLAWCALGLWTPIPSEAALDEFLTYKIKDSRGSICSGVAPLNVGAPCVLETDCGGAEDETAFCVPKGFPKRLRVSLTDRFETGTFDVQKPVALGTPASRAGRAIGDPQTHLKSYQIVLTKTAPRQPAHVKRTSLLVRNVFHPAGGELTLDTQKPDRLLVPTALNLTGPVAGPDPATHAVDHYKCYTVKPSRNAPAFVVIRGVSIEGPFATPARRYDLKKPSRLCVPVETAVLPGGTMEPIENANGSLLCYQAALTRTVPAQPKHQPVTGIFLGNHFGPERVDTSPEQELCVPSLLLPAIGCTPDATRTCYDGPAGTEGVGLCHAGTQTCGGDGTFGPCTGQVVPVPEIAGDGIDQDCDGADQPGGDSIPPSTVTLDPTVRIEVTEVEGLDGAAPRPVTALTDRSGIPMHFVENELIVVSDDAGAAAALADRYGGTVVKSIVPAAAGLAGVPAQHLIRVAPSFADVPQLVADLRAIEPGTRNDLRVASAAGLQLLAAAARETALGTLAVLNVVMQPQGFEERTTTENGSLTICPAMSYCAVPPVPPLAPIAGCNCGIPGPGAATESFNSNAFTWSYMMDGGPQDIGVGEAWRSLSLAGLLGNQVTIAVIDRGFSNLAVDNPTATAYLNAVNPLEPDVYPANTGLCSGSPCPWHGANVVSAAMGPADDAKGAAGPAGPIASAVTIRHGGDQFTASLGVIANIAGPARIINMSFGQRHPATLSWMAGPSNLLTLALHGAGKLVVAAAGNDNADVDSVDCLPFPLDDTCWEDAWWTPCENGGVFCIGALRANATTRASYSNWGNEEVDLFGPGTVWVGGDPADPEPEPVSGTSVAAPFVAGVAADPPTAADSPRGDGRVGLTSPSLHRTTIAVAHGDGIGPEIMAAALRVLDAVGAPLDFETVEMGRAVYERGTSSGITPETRDVVERLGLLLKAPLDTPKGGGAKSVNVTARKLWSTYANKRVFRSFRGVVTPFSRANMPIDLTIVRENIEDTYGSIEHMLTHDVALCRRFVTRPGSLQVHRYAFEVARRKGARKVTCGHKANIMKLTDGLFLECFYEIAKDYPEVRADDVIVDDLAMKLVVNPQAFDVIVLPNLQGDILSDLCAGLVGGLGFAPSANIGRNVCIFEAVHGTAPDIAGTNTANPTALVLSACMMLRHLGLMDEATRIEVALRRTLDAGCHTRDFGDPRTPAMTTTEFTDALIAHVPNDRPTGGHAEPVAVWWADAPRTQRMLESPRRHRTRLAGVDLFVESTAPADTLGPAIAGVLPTGYRVSMVSNRGTQVWPNGSRFTDCVNQYRVRVEADAGTEPTEDALLDLARMVNRVARMCSVEMLLLIGDRRGFSLAQGQ